MRNTEQSKLMYFLSAFGAEDRVLFRDYLHSPVFNKKEEPQRLYDFVVRHAFKSRPQEIDDARAVAAVWPDGKGDLVKLQKVKSALMALVASYLEFRNWQKRPASAQVALLEELNEMDDESYFQHYYKKAKADLEDAGQLSVQMLVDHLELEVQYMAFLQKHDIRSADSHLEETVAALKKVLDAYLLKFAFVIQNQKQIVGATDVAAWMQAGLAQIEGSDVAHEPLLALYHGLYHTLQAGTSQEDLHRLKALILAHAPRCAPGEAHDLYTGGINNILRSSKATGLAMSEDLLALYKSLVEVHHRKMGNRLEVAHFKNMVLIGARSGDFEWVLSVLGQGHELLKGDAAEVQAALTYNRGILHFYKGEYPEAERYLNRVLADVKDIFYASDARMYLLMCFYETGDTLGMETLAHSFRMFLERGERLSETHKESYLSFIRVFRRVLSTPPKDQIRLQQLKAEIDGLKLGAGKQWLLKKLAIIER